MSSGARLSSNCSMRGRGGFPWLAAGLDPPRSPRERSRPPYGRAPLADHHLCHHPAPITHHDSVSRQCASCALDLMDLVICILVGSPAKRKTTSDARRPPTSPRSTSPAAFRASVSQLAAEEPLMGGRPFRFPLGSNRQRLSPYVRSTAPSKARTLPAKVTPASSARLTHSTTPADAPSPPAVASVVNPLRQPFLL